MPTLALFTLLTLSVLLGYHIDNTPSKAPAAAEPVKTVVKKAEVIAPVPVPDPDPWPTAVADMNAAFAGMPNLSGAATLIDLSTGKQYDAGNYQRTYEAASTAKLVAVFDYIHLVEQGKATLNQTIGGDSAQDIIMRMIVYSDNDAWDKLNGYLKFKPQQAYLDGLGIKASMTPSNLQFYASSMAKLLQLLAGGKLMSSEHQAMVYNYMSHTTMNKLIPAALPADATIYHKYGQIDGVLHDASIVEYQGHQFVLVVYTDGGQTTAQTSLIHAVTTAAFNDVMKS